MISQRVRVVEGGKLVIPAAFRREMGVKPGDTLIVERGQGELRVRSLPSAIQRVQARMRDLSPEGRPCSMRWLQSGAPRLAVSDGKPNQESKGDLCPRRQASPQALWQDGKPTSWTPLPCSA